MACTTQIKMDNRNEIAKAYCQLLDSGNPAGIDEVLASTLIDHDGRGGNAVEGVKGLIIALKSGFSNYKHNIETVELVGEDKVFLRWRMTATHTGNLFGTPASGKDVNFVGHDLLKIKDGKVAEVWHVENLLAMFEQIKAE